MPRSRIVIIGVGNYLMGDEGAGIHAVHKLRTIQLPDNCEVVDGGTAGLGLLHIIEDRDLAIIIDCADFGGAHGEIKIFDPKDLKADDGPKSGLHAIDLVSSLDLARATWACPKKIFIAGIQFEKYEMGTTLSHSVSLAVEAIGDIMREIIRAETCRRRIEVRGTVQGVGFRPFVYKLARELALTGFVHNDSDGVTIEVQGITPSLDRFVAGIRQKHPPLARVDEIIESQIEIKEERDFSIEASAAPKGARTLVSPDIAPCADCLAEFSNPKDRRLLYPFINCTNCGPRYTIIESLPYDRPKTTMKSFRMCKECGSEYSDPADRRFHAQPNACAECGPELQLLHRRDGKAIQLENPIETTFKFLDDGKIAAIKGIGGFHLACDATNSEAVAKLRFRKKRDEKPFAVMVGDLESAKELCHISEIEEALLTSPERPIVLLRKKAGAPVSGAVAPGNKNLGLMLPSSPLHHLLFSSDDVKSRGDHVALRERRATLRRGSGQASDDFHASCFMLPASDLCERPFDGAQGRRAASDPSTGLRAGERRVLVMTSGNITDEPLAYANDECMERLGDIADAFLVHNRDIRTRVDDSIARVVNGRPQVIRRARGYTPAPIRLPYDAPPRQRRGGIRYLLPLEGGGNPLASSDDTRLRAGGEGDHCHPLPIPLPSREREWAVTPPQAAGNRLVELPQILATGADLKGAICLTKGRNAFLSQHLGDLENALAHRAFEDAIEHMKNLFDIKPEIVAHDLHPDYFSTRFAKKISGATGARAIGIQHHHAHIAACMAENGLPNEKILGIALDGTGLGTDGTIWGGEILIADYAGFERAARFAPMALPGGDIAAKEPWRMAVTYMQKALINDACIDGIPSEQINLVRQMIDKDINCPKTSSCGRLFDAVAAIIGLCARNSFEGQAAMMLEQVADEDEGGEYKFVITNGTPSEIDFTPTIAYIVDDLAHKVPQSIISARFHNTLVSALVGTVRLIVCSLVPRPSSVALSGGCFQNALLSERLEKRLVEEGFKVYTHSLVAPNDGGIALGQAVIAANNDFDF